MYSIKDYKSRSITAENPTGGKGIGGRLTNGTGAKASADLGIGWKVSPSIKMNPFSKIDIATIEGSGIINHMWMTCFHEFWRDIIIRIYWEHSDFPSVEVPFGDFFSNPWCEPSLIDSEVISVNPRGGMNSYWQMPFKENARIELENIGCKEVYVYYQIDYTLREVKGDFGYFHTQWNASKPLKYMEDHNLLTRIMGKGHYVGTSLGWQVNSRGWWGEGEVKIFIDGDEEFPTICGTGTEDYFGGAWNFEQPIGQYCGYSTRYLGMHQVIRPDGLYNSQQRFSMYRWHLKDPIYFSEDIRVTIQALGWRNNEKYLPLQDTLYSVAYLYLKEVTSIQKSEMSSFLLEIN